jgi:tRNA1(Val) A37 N6-methylase TrmN6
MKINRVWAMPNKNTFQIKPIKELIGRYYKSSYISIDPFANSCKLATYTNDLNPEYGTTHNMDALDFLKSFQDNSVDFVFYDPPYSITQATQCYKSYGKDKLEQSVSNMGYWGSCKNEVARVLKDDGCVICFGWNSMGIGITRGFEMHEILLVAHGGSKNDTIVTVETKKKNLFS